MSRKLAPPAVLLVTSSYPRWAGDATTPFVHHLAQDLRALGWDVRVLAPHAPGARREEVLDGVPVRRFRYAWPESLEALCYDGGALVRLRANRARLLLVPLLVAAQIVAVTGRLLRGRAVLVHSHWLLPQGFTCAIAARLLGRRHVTTAHGGDVFALQGTVSRCAKRIVLNLADVITVNSDATRRAVSRLTNREEKIIRIPIGASAGEGADLSRVAMLRAALRPGNGPLLAFVGRLIPEKGGTDLLEAVAILARSLPDITVVVVGDGPQRGGLEQQAQALGIRARVQFTGWLEPEAVRQHLRAADIFVAPSRPAPDGWVEAQGLSIVEAMLAELPIIATECGGIPDAVRHGQTGLLVAPGSPGAVADAVIRLVGDAALGQRLARTARELALAEFTRETSAGRFSALYAGLVANQGYERSKT